MKLFAGLALWIAVVASMCDAAKANRVEQVNDKVQAAHSGAARVQTEIDELEQSRLSDEQRYLAATRAAALAEGYNRQLQALVNSQREELRSLRDQADSVAATGKALSPLMVDMRQSLAAFVEADQPFLLEERRQRVARLTAQGDRADVTLAEKYRQILEAYRVEAEYGRTLEAWRGAKPGEPEREVDYVRLGRVGLYYLGLDGHGPGRWSVGSAAWQALPETDAPRVAAAIALARQQIIPELLTLPLDAPENLE